MSRRSWVFFTFVGVIIGFLTGPLLAGAQTVSDDPPPLSGLGNEDLWAIIAGAITPWVVATINRVRWQPITKWLVFFGISLAMAAVTVFVRDQLDAQNYIRTALLVAATATITYIGWKSAIHNVEARTG